jgi:drug/metabolite transporter (DMT)-like permease
MTRWKHIWSASDHKQEHGRMSNRILPTLAVLAVGVLWGIFWIPMRLLDDYGVGAAWVSVVFFAVMMLAPLPWLIAGQRWTVGGRQVVAGVLLGTAFTFYTCSLLLTDVIHAILLFYLTPIWSTIAGFLLYASKPTMKRILAIVLGLAGMMFILGAGEDFPWPRSIGDWIALTSGMLWAAGSMLTAESSDTDIAMPVALFGFGGVMSSLAFVGLAKLAGSEVAASGTVIANLPLMIGLALLLFVPTNALVLWAQQKMDAPRVGILLMGEVVVGSITAALFSGEAYSVADLIGTLLIIGAGLTEVLSRSKTPAQA